MAIADYLQSVADVRPLVELIEKGSQNQHSLTKAGFDPQLLSPAIAASIVLLVGRFEQFLKELGAYALDSYSRATPPIVRTQLPANLQVGLLFHNLTASMQSKRHGTTRAALDRIRAIDSAANKVVANTVWGDDVIQTYSNPSGETVQDILQMLGVARGWGKVETKFAAEWKRRQRTKTSLKSIPNARAELDNILRWRNTVAHSRSSLAIGPQELVETMEFFEAVGVSLNLVLKKHFEDDIVRLSSTPPAW